MRPRYSMGEVDVYDHFGSPFCVAFHTLCGLATRGLVAQRSPNTDHSVGFVDMCDVLAGFVDPARLTNAVASNRFADTSDGCVHRFLLSRIPGTGPSRRDLQSALGRVCVPVAAPDVTGSAVGGEESNLPVSQAMGPPGGCRKSGKKGSRPSGGSSENDVRGND